MSPTSASVRSLSSFNDRIATSVAANQPLIRIRASWSSSGPHGKKYVAKLLYKWRQELYENKEILNFLNYKVDEKSLKEEISNIGSDDEQDHVLDGIELELKVKFNELVTSKKPIF